MIPRFRLRNKDTLVILYTCGRSAAVSSPFVNLMRLYRSRGIGPEKVWVNPGVRRERDWSKIRFCAVPWGRNTRLFALWPDIMQAHSSNTCAVSSRQRQCKRLTAIRGIQVCCSLWCDRRIRTHECDKAPTPDVANCRNILQISHAGIA